MLRLVPHIRVCPWPDRLILWYLTLITGLAILCLVTAALLVLCHALGLPLPRA